MPASSDLPCLRARRSRRGRCSTWRWPPAAIRIPAQTARRWRRSGPRSAPPTRSLAKTTACGPRSTSSTARTLAPPPRSATAPESRKRQPQRLPLALRSTLALAHAEVRREGARDFGSLSGEQSPRDQVVGRGAHHARELAQQRTQQVGRHDAPPALVATGGRRALAAQVELEHGKRSVVDDRVGARSLDALAAVVDSEHRCKAQPNSGYRQ